MPEFWNQCTRLLKQDLSDAEFNTWIMPLQASEEGSRLRLFAPNRFVKDWVKQHYEQRIASLCEGVSQGQIERVSFEIGASRETSVCKGGEARVGAGQTKATKATLEQRRSDAGLNGAFNFDTFVEGKSNQIARAASIQIGQNPGIAYNPLFVYGGVGLGKTHLMHAIGNAILEANLDARVIYVHSERFVSDMIRALQHNEIEKFKKLYRRVNVLLIDDVQFFAGKDRSQEEFFHTFNALFEAQQQIVLSSDRFPKEVTGLEERLRSRFGWGLTVAIEPPDLETRVAILNSKAALLGIELPDDVAFFVAKRVRSNVRELEGALRRLAANSRFLGLPISVDFAKDALRDMLVAQDKQVSIENIQKAVAAHYKIRVSDLLSPSRSRSVTRPRQLAMTLSKELTKHSLPEIGKAFGGRDHSTVIHAAKKIAELRGADALVEEDYKILLRTLQS